MSNIKEIDGVFVNLDLVKHIVINGCEENLNFHVCFCFRNEYKNVYNGQDEVISDNRVGLKNYKTYKEAEERIRQIIKEQNDNEKIEVIEELINLGDIIEEIRECCNSVANRIVNVLYNNNINTTNDLLNLRERKLLMFTGMGRKSLKILKLVLKNHELKLKG